LFSTITQTGFRCDDGGDFVRVITFVNEKYNENHHNAEFSLLKNEEVLSLRKLMKIHIKLLIQTSISLKRTTFKYICRKL